MRIVLLLALVAVPVLASGTEAPLMDFGSAPVEAVTPAQPLISDAVASALGLLALKALIDSVASAFNQHLRNLKAKGIKASPLKLFVGSVLNGLAFNFDQMARQGKAGAAKAPEQPQ